MGDASPVELPRDVFLLLLDAYREARDYQLRNLYGQFAPMFDDLIMQRRQQIAADCDGWRVRYEAAEHRPVAVGTIEPDPTHPGRYVRKWMSDKAGG